MELLVVCLSLWMLQCRSARADSIIHIGKGPTGMMISGFDYTAAFVCVSRCVVERRTGRDAELGNRGTGGISPGIRCAFVLWCNF